VHQNLFACQAVAPLTSLTTARLVREIALRDLPAARFIPGSPAWARPCLQDLPPPMERVTREARFPGELRQPTSWQCQPCLRVLALLSLVRSSVLGLRY
jgi:hypothetical protein